MRSLLVLSLLPWGLACPVREAGLVPSVAVQATPASEPHSSGAVLLKVTGEAAKPLEFTADRFGELPSSCVAAKGHDGRESRYEGVALSEILRLAGVPQGKELRGKGLALYLVVEAADGYRAVFALPELDPEFTDRPILLADRRDGRPLSEREGPLQVIVPAEKRHSRWVRQVVALRIGKA